MMVPREKKRIYAEAYGCAMNRGEAGQIVRSAFARGFELTDAPGKASVILLATCVVIDSTERKVLRRARALAKTGVPIIVAGCASATCANKVREAAPDAAICKPGAVGSADTMLLAVAKSCPKVVTKDCAPIAPPRVATASRVPFTRSGDRVCPIPIASGCRGSCAYCITRIARGALQSRSVDDVVADSQKAVDDGAVEIQLCAQDAAVFGDDTGESLPDLISAVCRIDGDFMVRVGMMNPEGVARQMPALLGAYDDPKVFKFLHLPVQSGDDSILDAMGRRYSSEDARNIMAAFRGRFPGATISTDVIVGFPGEGMPEHRATLDFISQTRPDIVNVTRYSPRPGTRAYGMAPPHGRTVKARSRELAELRFPIALENNRRFVGEDLGVLSTEAGKGETTLARTRDYRQVALSGRIALGKRYIAHIFRATSINLFGKCQ
jgi:MiaB-like tRNA modifying enzyme